MFETEGCPQHSASFCPLLSIGREHGALGYRKVQVSSRVMTLPAKRRVVSRELNTHNFSEDLLTHQSQLWQWDAEIVEVHYKIACFFFFHHKIVDEVP